MVWFIWSTFHLIGYIIHIRKCGQFLNKQVELEKIIHTQGFPKEKLIFSQMSKRLKNSFRNVVSIKLNVKLDVIKELVANARYGELSDNKIKFIMNSNHARCIFLFLFIILFCYKRVKVSFRQASFS